MFSQLVQFSWRWYLCAWESTSGLHPVSQEFPQCCLWNSSDQCWSDWRWPFLVLSRNIVERFLFLHLFLQAIDGVMFLALCQQLVSQAPAFVSRVQQYVRRKEKYSCLKYANHPLSLGPFSLFVRRFPSLSLSTRGGLLQTEIKAPPPSWWIPGLSKAPPFSA